MKKVLFFTLLILVNFTMICRANIFDKLTNSDSGEGTVILHQDERIKDLIYKKKEINAKEVDRVPMSGYRVQVYSSNDQRNGKLMAYKIETKIKEKFPNYNVYVTYASPFWKVRVGDCKTTAEAQSLRSEIKKGFSDLQQETYIVKDQILLPNF